MSRTRFSGHKELTGPTGSLKRVRSLSPLEHAEDILVPDPLREVKDVPMVCGASPDCVE